MENLDVMVLRTLRDWRQAGKRALLATVVRTWGSSPRPVGSIMGLGEAVDQVVLDAAAADGPDHRAILGQRHDRADRPR